MFSIFERKGKTETPWYGRVSIYAFIKQNLDKQTERLPEDYDKLPDDEIRFKEGELRWVSGAMDGAFGHHGGGSQSEEQSKRIAHLLKVISQTGKDSSKIELYKILQEDSVLDYIDESIEKAVALNISPEPYLHTFANFLAKESPDRGPVKFGIALLGIIQDSNDKPLIMLLGKHEEFTLFSAVALSNMSQQPEGDLFDLAKKVNGWGRIHLVESLEGTDNKEIQEWMLRDGYKNSIMYEYLAYICATSGKLRESLKITSLDKGMFNSAGDLIEALISGGPARDIYEYDDAADVISMYLHHFTNQPKQLKHYLVLQAIKGYLSSDSWDIEEQKSSGWQLHTRERALSTLENLLNDIEWKTITEKALKSADNMDFFNADRAARYLKMDTWDIHWHRLIEEPADSGRWFYVMRESNLERIDAILSLAESKIPLDSISTGAADEMGMGPEYNWHSVLDYILQDLDQYPGKGEKLILTGLQSPVIRNRNMALKALTAWSLDIRGEKITDSLKSAYKLEPDADVKDSIKNVIDGKEID
ncbi:MAG: hypothetical protein ABW098_04395 [Candidatus Thiodiazotropha sp.]